MVWPAERVDIETKGIVAMIELIQNCYEKKVNKLSVNNKIAVCLAI